MADLRIMRRKLEEQIHQLQERLRALELVEQTARELNGQDPSSRHVRAHRNGTIMDACRQIIQESSKTEWRAAEMLEEVERRGLSEANRENISTTMRRLAQTGVLERT